MNLDLLNGEGWRLLWCSALLGVIPEWLHFLVIGVLLCIACGLLHVWAELNRILASLYEMKCLEDAEGQRPGRLNWSFRRPMNALLSSSS